MNIPFALSEKAAELFTTHEPLGSMVMQRCCPVLWKEPTDVNYKKLFMWVMQHGDDMSGEDIWSSMQLIMAMCSYYTIIKCVEHNKLSLVTSTDKPDYPRRQHHDR